MSTPLNLHDYEALARERLPPMVYDYYAGGANDEITVAENTRSWQRVRLRQRVLVNVSHIDPTTTVLGHTLTMPVLTAPCSFNTLAHPEGECAVARATSAAGIVQVVSLTATRTIEEIAAAAQGPRWFQLICFRDREITRALVQRAEAANCSALCLTVDQPLLGRRERDLRDCFHLPPGVTMKNLVPYLGGNLSDTQDGYVLARHVNELWDSSLTWEIIDWLCSIMHLPVLAKGILAPEDARLALEHGAAGVIVSNHGGQQFDSGSVRARHCQESPMPSAGARKCW